MFSIEGDLSYAEERADKLEEALKKCKRYHRYCEDPWYSCPKAEDGCIDDTQGSECNCGADEINAIIEKALKD